MGFSTIGGVGGGSEETPSGGGGSSEGVEDNSSSNADQIQINDGSVVINKDNDDCDFIVESVNSALMFKVDAANDTVSVGCDAVEAASNNPSALLVVSNRSTASTPASYAPLVVENDAAAAYVNVISNDNGWQGILFGDQTDPDEASIKYNSANKRMYITGNAEAVASNVLTIDHLANTVGVNVGAPSAGALDVDGAIALKSQASDPSVTADYSKIYSKEIVGEDGTTVLLCHFEGSDAATTGDGILDSSATSPHTIAFVGNAQIDTAQYKWGASSLLLDGTGDYATVTDSADFDWAGEFTVEMWVRFNSTSGEQNLIESAYGDTAFFRIRWDGTNNEWDIGAMNSAYSASDSLSTNTWYHVAVTRDSANVVRVYRDGVHKGNSTIAGTIGNTSGLTIGSRSHTGGASGYGGVGNYVNGWLDEIRINKGTALYTGAGGFTPPAAPFTTTQSVLILPDRTRVKSGTADLGEMIAFAWVSFNDSTNLGGGGDVDGTGRAPESSRSYNVSNVKDGDFSGDEGQYEITFTNAASNTGYLVVGGADSNSTGYAGALQGTRATTSFQGFVSEGGSWNDADEVNFLVFQRLTK